MEGSHWTSYLDLLPGCYIDMIFYHGIVIFLTCKGCMNILWTLAISGITELPPEYPLKRSFPVPFPPPISFLNISELYMTSFKLSPRISKCIVELQLRKQSNTLENKRSSNNGTCNLPSLKLKSGDPEQLKQNTWIRVGKYRVKHAILGTCTLSCTLQQAF